MLWQGLGFAPFWSELANEAFSPSANKTHLFKVINIQISLKACAISATGVYDMSRVDYGLRVWCNAMLVSLNLRPSFFMFDLLENNTSVKQL